jgi:hypothetical protein
LQVNEAAKLLRAAFPTAPIANVNDSELRSDLIKVAREGDIIIEIIRAGQNGQIQLVHPTLGISYGIVPEPDWFIGAQGFARFAETFGIAVVGADGAQIAASRACGRLRGRTSVPTESKQPCSHVPLGRVWDFPNKEAGPLMAEIDRRFRDATLPTYGRRNRAAERELIRQPIDYRIDWLGSRSLRSDYCAPRAVGLLDLSAPSDEWPRDLGQGGHYYLPEFEDLSVPRDHWERMLSELGFAASSDTVSKAEPETVELRWAGDNQIDQAITAEYDDAQRKGSKPPNIREIVKPVLLRLSKDGHTATGVRIQKIAGADRHKKRRRPIGKTVASEKSH